MTQRIAFDCDACRERDIPWVAKLGFHVGWSPDPAGGPSDRDIEDFELCPECVEWLNDLLNYSPKFEAPGDYMARIVTVIHKELPFSEAQKRVDEIKKRIRNRTKPCRHPDLAPGG